MIASSGCSRCRFLVIVFVVYMNSITHRGDLWVMSVTVSEEVGPGTMLSISNLTFLQQTITDTAEDFKLLLSGEIVGTIT